MPALDTNSRFRTRFAFSNEEKKALIKEEEKKRRIRRLLEVRAQERNLSVRTRQQYYQRKRQLEELAIDSRKSVWTAKQDERLHRLDQKMHDTLTSIGSGCNAARDHHDAEVSNAKEAYSAMLAAGYKAKRRFTTAMEKERQEDLKRTVPERTRAQNREQAREMENERSRIAAAKGQLIRDETRRLESLQPESVPSIEERRIPTYDYPTYFHAESFMSGATQHAAEIHTGNIESHCRSRSKGDRKGSGRSNADDSICEDSIGSGGSDDTACGSQGSGGGDANSGKGSAGSGVSLMCHKVQSKEPTDSDEISGSRLSQNACSWTVPTTLNGREAAETAQTRMRERLLESSRQAVQARRRAMERAATAVAVMSRQHDAVCGEKMLKEMEAGIRAEKLRRVKEESDKARTRAHARAAFGVWGASPVDTLAAMAGPNHEAARSSSPSPHVGVAAAVGSRNGDAGVGGSGRGNGAQGHRVKRKPGANAISSSGVGGKSSAELAFEAMFGVRDQGGKIQKIPTSSSAVPDTGSAEEVTLPVSYDSADPLARPAVYAAEPESHPPQQQHLQPVVSTDGRRLAKDSLDVSEGSLEDVGGVDLSSSAINVSARSPTTRAELHSHTTSQHSTPPHTSTHLDTHATSRPDTASHHATSYPNTASHHATSHADSASHHDMSGPTTAPNHGIVHAGPGTHPNNPPSAVVVGPDGVPRPESLPGGAGPSRGVRSRSGVSGVPSSRYPQEYSMGGSVAEHAITTPEAPMPGTGTNHTAASATTSTSRGSDQRNAVHRTAIQDSGGPRADADADAADRLRHAGRVDYETAGHLAAGADTGDSEAITSRRPRRADHALHGGSASIATAAASELLRGSLSATGNEEGVGPSGQREAAIRESGRGSTAHYVSEGVGTEGFVGGGLQHTGSRTVPVVYPTASFELQSPASSISSFVTADLYPTPGHTATAPHERSTSSRSVSLQSSAATPTTPSAATPSLAENSLSTFCQPSEESLEDDGTSPAAPATLSLSPRGPVVAVSSRAGSAARSSSTVSTPGLRSRSSDFAATPSRGSSVSSEPVSIPGTPRAQGVSSTVLQAGAVGASHPAPAHVEGHAPPRDSRAEDPRRTHAGISAFESGERDSVNPPVEAAVATTGSVEGGHNAADSATLGIPRTAPQTSSHTTPDAPDTSHTHPTHPTPRSGRPPLPPSPTSSPESIRNMSRSPRPRPAPGSPLSGRRRRPSDGSDSQSTSTSHHGNSASSGSHSTDSLASAGWAPEGQGVRGELSEDPAARDADRQTRGWGSASVVSSSVSTLSGGMLSDDDSGAEVDASVPLPPVNIPFAAATATTARTAPAAEAPSPQPLTPSRATTTPSTSSLPPLSTTPEHSLASYPSSSGSRVLSESSSRMRGVEVEVTARQIFLQARRNLRMADEDAPSTAETSLLSLYTLSTSEGLTSPVRSMSSSTYDPWMDGVAHVDSVTTVLSSYSLSSDAS